MIFPTTFVLALLFAQATRALPQPGNASVSPTSPTGSSYSPTPSSSSSPYSSSSSACPCYVTPTPYAPGDKNSTLYTSSGSYPASSSSCSCSSSTPYPSSQPPYTSSSSYTSSKEPYPPTTMSPYPYVPPSKPSGSCNTPEPSTPPTTLKVTFDTTYDNKDGSLNNVACSNGANGLARRFATFSDIPSFPFIGGAFDVVWNSPNCGGCWTLTNAATGVSINITAIDTAGAGFNIAKEAFVQLNGGQVGQGVANVVATKVSPSVCGL